MMNDIKRKKHTQIKFFTVMLIPYTGDKTRSIQIPHWIGYVLFGLFLCFVSFLTYSIVKNNTFKQKIESFNIQLEEKEHQKNEIQNKSLLLEDEMNQLERKNSQIENNLSEQEEEYSKQLEEYMQQIKEAEEKIEKIEAEKNEIYNKISKNINVSNELKASPQEFIQSDASIIQISGRSAYEQELELELSSINDVIDRLLYEFVSLNKMADKYKIAKDSYPSGWPVIGTVTCEAGWRKDPFSSGNEYHSGMDIRAATGTSVRCTASGRVTHAGWSNGYGYLVTINHGNGLETYYAHNSQLTVGVGDYVEKGSIIAKSGSTGRSTGPHVHYEVRLNGEIKNPRDYIEE